MMREKRETARMRAHWEVQADTFFRGTHIMRPNPARRISPRHASSKSSKALLSEIDIIIRLIKSQPRPSRPFRWFLIENGRRQRHHAGYRQAGWPAR